MEKETIEKILDFLEKEENKNAPFMWKLLNNKPLTKEQLTIKGHLRLTRTNITSLPKDLNVLGYLNLIDCKNLKSIQEGLYVREDLYLGGCINFESLPNDSFVGGNLHLEYCENLSSLPNGLKVEGNLFINNTPLAKKYTNEEIRDMVKPDGYIIGYILR